MRIQMQPLQMNRFRPLFDFFAIYRMLDWLHFALYSSIDDRLWHLCWFQHPKWFNYHFSLIFYKYPKKILSLKLNFIQQILDVFYSGHLIAKKDRRHFAGLTLSCFIQASSHSNSSPGSWRDSSWLTSPGPITNNSIYDIPPIL